MSKQDIEQLALDHWNYVESIAKKMYIDAFIHGHKHGVDFNGLIKNCFKRLRK